MAIVTQPDLIPTLKDDGTSIMDLLIREARTQDAEAILSLTVEGIQTWGENILDKLVPWTDETCNLPYIEQRLGDANYRSFVAEKDARVVGVIYVRVDDADASHMGGLYCLFKRSGIGSALLRKAMSESKKLGYSHMKCEVYVENKASIALMTKHNAACSHSELYDDVEYFTYVIPLTPSGGYGGER